MEREIRRNQNYLVILGTGVIAFAAWSVVRTLAQYFIQYAELEAIVEVYLPRDSAELIMMALLIVIIISLVIDIALRLFVGLSARAEGKGRKKRIAYLIAAGVIIALHVISIAVYIYIMTTSLNDIVECIIGIVIELTAAITVVELMMASVRLRKLTAKVQ